MHCSATTRMHYPFYDLEYLVMKEATNRSLLEVATRSGKRYLKKAAFLLRRPRGKARPVFIMGYGRSGTTMLSEAFDHDMRIEVL